jgi:multicomponent Na+:H+ antiporter subunit C
MDYVTPEILSVAMFFVSFYGLIASKSIIKSIISVGLMEMAVIMFIISIGFADGMVPPIGKNQENAADPLPQALVLTAIVIGVAVTAVNVVFFISLSRQYRATDWDAVKNRDTV